MSSGTPRLARVAVARPLPGPFTYAVPPELAARLERGARVRVPFGRATALGFYLGEAEPPPPGIALKPLVAVLDEQPPLTGEVLDLVEWAATYWRYPLGEALRSALPPGLTDPRPMPEARVSTRAFATLVPQPEGAKPPRGAVMQAVVSYLSHVGRTELEELASAIPGARDAVKRLESQGRLKLELERNDAEEAGGALAPGSAPKLQPMQQAAVEALTSAIDAGGFAPFLLHGVTGSGKTEVYLQAIARTLARGQGALVLVPEIGLTPQLVGRFRARFGARVAVLHSGLKDAERLAAWRLLREGGAEVAVGVRSAVFAPVPNLGLVVVDEEHDGSFKQADRLRYHARDLAVVRAQKVGCPVVLGSATPSLETLDNARRGRYRLLEMKQRIDDRPLPPVELIDLRSRPRAELAPPEDDGLLAPPLVEALRSTLERGEQSILFLNRRGLATAVTCTACGRTCSCPNCSVGLTLHAARRALTCHLCGHREAEPERCRECRGDLVRLGAGTERIEEELSRRFPAARVLRLDRDSAPDASELTRALSDFARGRYDLMVGTQMVAKGHDFPGVTLVGVVLADTALALPDFRAAERTFQLLTQVAGRAGRGTLPGRVLIQTYAPETAAVARVQGHDFDGFAMRELQVREAMAYPPFTRLVAVQLEGLDEGRVRLEAQRLAAVAEQAIRGQTEPLRLLGPAPASVARVRAKWRWQLLLKGKSQAALRPIVERLEAAAREGHTSVRVAFDIDPIHLL